MRNLGKLKMYNSMRKEKQEETPNSPTLFLGAYASNQRSKANIFVTEHLPAAFYEQKNCFYRHFEKHARQEKQSGPFEMENIACLWTVSKYLSDILIFMLLPKTCCLVARSIILLLLYFHRIICDQRTI